MPKGVYVRTKPVWNKGKKMPQISGENAYQWKGDDVGYVALHKWVYKHLGQPDTCSGCGTSGLSGHQIHWANLSGLYKRVLSDWKRLCVYCHNELDNTFIQKGQHLSPATEFKRAQV